MVIYLLGIPGSGKSYYAVNVIYDNFAKDIPKNAKLSLKKDYLVCYTNIDGFNFDLVNNVYPLDFSKLLSQLEILYFMKMQGKSDEELIEKAKEFNIYKALFVIDEAHNYFNNDNKILVWWLTYHRHLYQDIILITQNLALIHSKYKPLSEMFLKAKPPSLSLSKKYFYYKHFTESRLSQASYVKTIKLLKKPEVFKLYHSGDKVVSENVILRFILFSFFFLVLLFAGFYFFFLSKLNDSKVKVDVPSSNSQLQSQVSQNVQNVSNKNYQPVLKKDDLDPESIVLLTATCKNNFCYLKDVGKYIDIKVLRFARDYYNLEIISIRNNFGYGLITFSVDSSFLKFVKGGINYEHTKNSEDGMHIETSNILPFTNGE